MTLRAMKGTMAEAFLYNNITISGLPGSGSTTLLNELREHPVFKFHGWTGFSGGEYMREYAQQKGILDAEGKLHHSANAYPDDFDREVDLSMREKLGTQAHWILESWLSGFVSQGVPKVLKVLIMCSNTAVRVDRIVNRDSVTADEALNNMNYRYKTNLAKWRRMYKNEWIEWVVKPGTMSATAPIDFWHPNLYDIVIDTYSTNKTETLDIVLHAIHSN